MRKIRVAIFVVSKKLYVTALAHKHSEIAVRKKSLLTLVKPLQMVYLVLPKSLEICIMLFYICFVACNKRTNLLQIC